MVPPCGKQVFPILETLGPAPEEEDGNSLMVNLHPQIWSAALQPEPYTDLGGDESRQGCKAAYVHCDSNTEKRDAASVSGLSNWCVAPGHRTRIPVAFVPPGHPT